MLGRGIVGLYGYYIVNFFGVRIYLNQTYRAVVGQLFPACSHWPTAGPCRQQPHLYFLSWSPVAWLRCSINTSWSTAVRGRACSVKWSVTSTEKLPQNTEFYRIVFDVPAILWRNLFECGSSATAGRSLAALLRFLTWPPEGSAWLPMTGTPPTPTVGLNFIFLRTYSQT